MSEHRSRTYRTNILAAARRIKFQRKELGWTQQKLAEQAGVSTSFVSKFENAKGTEFSIGHYLAVCRTLGLDPLRTWFGDEGGGENRPHRR